MFFTHPRNAGRHDLGCPFGCRKAHRRKNAIQRSTEYYQTKEGKQKKKYLNAGRRGQNRLSSRDENGKDDCGTKINDTVCHIRMVTTLIEGRDVGWGEIAAMVLRQHSIDMFDKMAYFAICHQKSPP